VRHRQGRGQFDVVLCVGVGDFDFRVRIRLPRRLGALERGVFGFCNSLHIEGNLNALSKLAHQLRSVGAELAVISHVEVFHLDMQQAVLKSNETHRDIGSALIQAVEQAFQLSVGRAGKLHHEA